MKYHEIKESETRCLAVSLIFLISFIPSWIKRDVSHSLACCLSNFNLEVYSASMADVCFLDPIWSEILARSIIPHLVLALHTAVCL